MTVKEGGLSFSFLLLVTKTVFPTQENKTF